MLLEICANSVQSAVNAERGGASRIELCQNLNEGGTTPSRASIMYCVTYLELDTFVLIRPRAGDFCYNDLEYKIMKEDIMFCKHAGVKGIVTGFLNPDYTVDAQRTREIVELAAPMQVTFHRAFDVAKNWAKSLETIIDCGCHRILTSGHAVTAREGMGRLRLIHEIAAERIIILAGSGVNSENVTDLAHITGIQEYHASCKKKISTLPEDSGINWLDISNVEHWETDIDEVAALKTQLETLDE